MADIVMSGDLAAAQALTTKVVKEIIAARTNVSISDNAADLIVNDLYRNVASGGDKVIGEIVAPVVPGGTANSAARQKLA